MEIKTGIGVIILDNNRVLLGHRVQKYTDTGGIYEPDSWTLPGGKQEVNETIIECATRETKEETSLDIYNIKVFGAGDDMTSDRHFVTIYTYTDSYKGEVQVMEKEKIDEWKWFDINDLPSNLYSPSEKEIIEFKKERNK